MRANLPTGRLTRLTSGVSTRDTWIDAAIALVCVLPLLLTAHLPLSDLPDHLARQFILQDWASSQALQTFYLIHWQLVPNLALDPFVLGARLIMSIDSAVRLFCIITVLLLFLGTRLVNRVLSNQMSRAYRVVPLLCYGGPFQLGFLNYCFGVGLALLLFGSYLRIRGRSSPAVAIFLVVSGIAVLLCHMAAFGLFALAVGGCELAATFAVSEGDMRRLVPEMLRRLTLPITCLMPLLGAFMWFGVSRSQNATVNAAVSHIQFDLFRGKARSIFAVVGFSSPSLEGGMLLMALAGLAIALVIKAIRFEQVGATVVGAMLAVWLMLPGVAIGTAYIDYRIPWAVSFFALASIVPTPQYERFSLPIGLYAATLAVLRIALISVFWLMWEPRLAQLDRALGSVPIGTRLFVVRGELPSGALFRQPDLEHAASYVVARRQGFETGIFAGFPGQILDFQPRYEQVWTQAKFGAELPSTLDDVPPDYDYVLVLLPAYARLSPGLPLSCAASGQVFDLYKIDRSGSPAAGTMCVASSH